MKKLRLIIPLFMIAFAVSVLSASDLIISPNEVGIIANINEVITKVITFSNLNPTDALTVSLPSQIKFIGSRNNLTLNLNYNVTAPLTVSPSNSLDIKYNLTIPTDAFNESYKGILNFTAQGNNFSEYIINLNITGNPNLKANNISSVIAINSTRTFNLNLDNIGNTDINANLIVEELISTTNNSNKIPSENIILTDTNLIIPYKKSVIRTFQIKIPENTPKEKYTGTIKIQYDSKEAISNINITASDKLYNIEFPSVISFPTAESNTTVKSVFNIKNTGNVELNLVNLTTQINPKYNLSFNTSQFNLGIGDSKIVQAMLYIPIDEEARNHSIGKVSITSKEITFKDIMDIFIDVPPKLEIESLDFFIEKDIDNEDASETNIEEGETITDRARPGSKIKLDFKIKNNYKEDSKIEIRDIIIKATIRGIDEDEDVELEGDEFDIDAGKSSSRKILTYEIPLVVDDDTYRIDIEVEGEDENGVKHTAIMKMFFKVDKRSHELIITEARLNPSTISCDRKVTVSSEILNTGKNNEEEVKIEITNSQLEINFVEDEIFLESNSDEDENKYEKTLSFDIDKDINSGTYPIIVKAYFSDDILDDMRELKLDIKDCENIVNAEQEDRDNTEGDVGNEKSDDDTETSSVISINENEEEEIIETEELPLSKNPFYLGLIVLVNIIIVSGLMFLIAMFMAKKVNR